MIALALPLLALAQADLPVVVWRQDFPAQTPGPVELFEPFGGANVERDDEADWVRERGYDFYVGHAPGRSELHVERRDAAWAERADPLVREPCLTAPTTLERLFATLDGTLAARGGDHGLFVSLGDEVGLTPSGSPSDVCRSQTCEAAWRALVDAPAPTTDEMLAARGADAVPLRRLWLARRDFHHEVVVDVLASLAQRARSCSPGARVGLLGLGGRTAFGGVDVADALSFCDVIEPYDVGGARELAFTLRGPEQEVWRTVFAHEEAPAAVALQAWEHWARGGDGFVVWSDRWLARRPDVRARLADAVSAMRAIENGSPARGPRGVALVHDARSLALAWLRDAADDGSTWERRFASYQEWNGSFERALRGWTRLWQDAGFVPGMVSLETVDAGLVSRFRLLVLSHVAALSDADVARLRAFEAAGGKLVLDGPFGEYDERGAPRAAPSSDAALRPPFGGGAYLDERFAPSGEERRDVARRLAAAAGVERAPFDVRSTPPLPWCIEWSEPDAEGRVRCVAVPNLTTPDERARLASPLEIEVQAARGTRVEWLVPADANGRRTTLAPGDAAVFTLVPQ